MAATHIRDPNVVNLNEAAGLLGISEKTALRRARAGRFPGLLPREKGERYKVSLPRFYAEVHSADSVRAEDGPPAPAQRNVPLEQRLAYSVEEVAGLIGAPCDLVYDWIEHGELVGTKLGKRLFVTREDLLAFLQQHRDLPSE